MADTLAASIAESTQELIDATILMLPRYSPTLNLVTRRTIPKGKNVAELPYVNTIPTVATPTEGDELTFSTEFDLASTTITPTKRAIRVRVAAEAQHDSKEALIAMISRWMAMAEANNIEDALVAQFPNFHVDNDVGTTDVDLLVSVLRRARRLLAQVQPVNGGPAPAPIAVVLSPIAAENLLADLGVQGVVASTSPWIPEGYSRELLQQYALLSGGNTWQQIGSGIFISSAINAATGDHICAMFSKEGLYFAVSQDWDMKTFEESDYDGVILRAIARYAAGIGPYSHFGAQITADGF